MTCDVALHVYIWRGLVPAAVGRGYHSPVTQRRYGPFAELLYVDPAKRGCTMMSGVDPARGFDVLGDVPGDLVGPAVMITALRGNTSSPGLLVSVAARRLAWLALTVHRSDIGNAPD